jgi:hypothetical protein
VLETGVATWDEDLLLFLERSGYPEETYHTFSYSPLDGPDGRVEGMLCVVTETTARVVGERRMATLRDLAAAVAATRTERDVLAAVDIELGRNLADLPFSLTYLIEKDGGARLAACSGIAPGSPAAPTTLAAEDAAAFWPLARLRTGEQVVVDLDGRTADLPTGMWQQPPHSAIAVPLATSAQRSTTATAASSTCWPARSPRGWSTPAATRRSAGGPSRSPSSTGRRRISSPTSATSSGPRSR